MIGYQGWRRRPCLARRLYLRIERFTYKFSAFRSKRNRMIQALILVIGTAIHLSAMGIFIKSAWYDCTQSGNLAAVERIWAAGIMGLGIVFMIGMLIETSQHYRPTTAVMITYALLFLPMFCVLALEIYAVVRGRASFRIDSSSAVLCLCNCLLFVLEFFSFIRRPKHRADRLKPFYRKKSYAVRKGVERIENDINSKRVLAKILVHGCNLKYCLAAMEKIDDQRVLTAAVCKARPATPGASAARAALRKITDQRYIAQIVKKSKVLHIRVKAAEQMNDPAAIRELVIRAETPVEIRLALLRKTSDLVLLERLAQEDPDADVRKCAVGTMIRHGMTRQDLLFRIALYDEDIGVRITAAAALTDPDGLCKLAMETKEYALSEFAVEQIDAEALTMDFYREFCQAKPECARLQIRILSRMRQPGNTEMVVHALSTYLNNEEAAVYAVAALEKIYSRLGITSIIRRRGEYPRHHPHNSSEEE